jgi:hypothetical protein
MSNEIRLLRLLSKRHVIGRIDRCETTKSACAHHPRLVTNFILP